MSITRCMTEMPYSEFLFWKQYIPQAEERKTPLIHYLAAIIRELRQDRRESVVPLHECYLTFTREQQTTQKPIEQKSNEVTKSDHIRSMIFACVGIPDGGNVH